VIPVEFILVKHATHELAQQQTMLLEQLERQQTMLLANGLSQSQALMLGKTSAQALAEKAPTASSAIDPQVLARHRAFPGNRPSTTLLLERLTPRSLGSLIAMYEHRIFTSGALWGINSFDQWGVELGKALCNELLPRLTSGDASGLDASTAGLLRRVRAR
jgi:glucose-6-phosphate isomerase